MTFKAYDVRGIFGEDITEEFAQQLGNALVQHYKCKEVVVGMDMRESSRSLFQGLSKGITDAGANVHNLGMCPTPVVSYAVATKDFALGIVISASHNPEQYNGFKIVKKPGYQVHTSELQEIKAVVERDTYSREEDGKVIDEDIMNEYLDHVISEASFSGLNLVIDYGNGVGAITAKPAYDKLDCDVLHLFPEPDGSFPNHEANPVVEENLSELKDRVLEKGAIGIAFDGDADRCILVDEKGKMVPVDLLTAFLSKYELRGDKVYYDLRFSHVVEEEVRRLGGEPVKMKVGNPFYKEALLEKGGAFAAEFSGHMMFPRNYCIDDGLFASIVILNALAKEGRSLSDTIESYRVHAATPEINMRVKDPEMVFSRLTETYSDGKFLDIDGITIEYPDWWFNLRKSNTEPVVRLRLEADSQELRDSKLAEVENLIKKE
ncbi:MAG: phosphomannomutase/phosphoglucomutase [Candidatus Woesearchaeota archaeon]